MAPRSTRAGDSRFVPLSTYTTYFSFSFQLTKKDIVVAHGDILRYIADGQNSARVSERKDILVSRRVQGSRVKLISEESDLGQRRDKDLHFRNVE